MQILNYIMSYFRSPSAEELIIQQRNRAERAYIEHLAAAETHQMLASAYKTRLERLSTLHREVRSGVKLELVDPLHVFHEVRA